MFNYEELFENIEIIKEYKGNDSIKVFCTVCGNQFDTYCGRNKAYKNN